MNIEFCGLPGCGKSYTINKLITTIPPETKVLNLSSAKKNNNYILLQKLTGIKRRLKILSPTVKAEKRAMDSYIINHPIDDRTAVFYRLLLEELLDIKKKSPIYDLTFGNEGIIQSMSSLSNDSLLDSEFDFVINTIDEYFYEKNQTIIFHCITNRETNIQRIKSRNRINDRFLLSNNDAINSMLNTKEHNIKYILNRLNNVRIEVIDITNSEKAIQIIKKVLKEYGYELYANNF